MIAKSFCLCGTENCRKVLFNKGQQQASSDDEDVPLSTIAEDENEPKTTAVEASDLVSAEEVSSTVSEPTAVPEEVSTIAAEPTSVPQEVSTVVTEPISIPEEISTVATEPTSSPEEVSTIVTETVSLAEEVPSVLSEPASVVN